MKKTLMILAALLAFSMQAGAQWYLFPGNKQKSGKENVKPVEEPRKPESPVVTDTVAKETPIEEAPADTAVYDEFVFDIPEIINVTLSLPLDCAAAKPRETMFDFYSGALMAVRDAGRQGKKINVNVLDNSNPTEKVSRDKLDGSDVIICCGPSRTLTETALNCPREKALVCPLDMFHSDSCKVIHEQTPWQYECDELMEWVCSDYKFGDEVIILRRGTSQNSDTLMRMVRFLDSLKIKYSCAQGVESSNNNRYESTRCTRRYVAVDNNNAFLHRTLQNVSFLGQQGVDVAFYTTSRIRNIKGLDDSKAYYNAFTHMVAQYHIDYGNVMVQNFILAFRTLFGCDPSRFALHGYDTMRYVLDMCSTYGRMWHKKLDEKPYEGYQTVFRYRKDVDDGLTNTAVRKIVYNKDLTTSIE